MAAAVPASRAAGRPGERGSALAQWASTRRPYLDNLKVLLIAAIIAVHAVLGYASLVEAWTYTELREVTLAPVTQAVLFVVAAPFGLFLIALLFLVAGLLTPSSMERKGTRRFVEDRLLRLGVPFLLYVLVVQPVLKYALRHPLGAAPGSFWEEYFGGEGRLDTGPLWFVGVLLVFSLGYAAWATAAARRREQRHTTAAPAVSMRLLALVALAVSPASFAVRLVYPYGSESGPSDLNFWEWPACGAAFALGTVAAGRGWLRSVPRDLARRCRAVTLLAALGTAGLLAALGLDDAIDDALGGWGWAAASFAVLDALLTVFGSVWLLGVAQRRLDHRLRWGPALARSAYGAFMVQTPFLLGIAVALRPVPLPAEVKALLVAAGAVAASFGTAWLLVTRVPAVSRVL